MALIRSRTVPGQAAALAAAGVDRAERDVASRLAAAREEGRLLGRAEAAKEWQPKLDAAEKRAKDSQVKADERIKAAEAELDRRLGQAVTGFEQALAQFAPLEKQAIAAAEAELVRLALAVAARVLRREVAADPAWMDAAVAAALDQVPDRREVVLRFEPGDAASVRARLRAIAAQVPSIEKIEVQDDPLAAKGSCVLMCRGTRLDASVHTSWERISAALLAEVPTPPLAVRQDGAETGIAAGTDPTVVRP